VRCLVCDAELGEAQAICAACAERLDNPTGLCREHIVWAGRGHEPRDAALIDHWGRPHFLRDRTRIGREPEDGLSVLESSVSRQHAELSMLDDTWSVRDLGSRNGTVVGATKVGASKVTTEPVGLTSGDMLVCGDVAMYFVVHERLLDGVLVAGASTRPSQDHLGPRLEELKIRLSVPTDHAGGAVELGGASVYLSPIQFELVGVLVDRMLDEPTIPPAVRGFVSSGTLLKTLTWSTPYPIDNNLKQLVRRVRRAMSEAGLGDLIESRQGFGYRLRFIPRVSRG